MRAAKKGLLFQVERAADAPRCVRADEGKLRQTLTNLLHNAITFTETGGVTMRLRAVALAPSLERTAKRGEQAVGLRIEIEDTGVGIAPENLARLFEPFTQFDSSLSRQQEGAGLGLTLVRHLTTLLGGTVEVTSHVGSGSCFTVSFPWQPSDDALPCMENAHETLDGEEHMSATSHSEDRMITVLLAEDNRESSEMFVEYLETMGFVVLWAKNGEEAISLARAQRPDIILMDIQMPVMDGLEAMRGFSMAQASAREEYLLRGMAEVFIQNSAHFLKIPPHSSPGVCSRAIVRRKSLRGSEGSEKSHG